MEERLSKIIEKWRWDDGSICSDIDSDIKAFIKAELAKEFDRGVAQGIELGHKSASDLADLELKANDKKWRERIKEIIPAEITSAIDWGGKPEILEAKITGWNKCVDRIRENSDSLLERKA